MELSAAELSKRLPLIVVTSLRGFEMSLATLSV